MDRRAKATLNRAKASRLNDEWKVGAKQVRYRENGTWYAKLERFPAALFDACGYILFETEQDYRNSPDIRIGKQISVSPPGISASIVYRRMADAEESQGLDVDIHDEHVNTAAAREGRQRLMAHLQRERNRSLVLAKKRSASTLECEICGFSFSRTYGKHASKYCEIHHLVPLKDAEETVLTRMEDLAIVCANCHRVLHLGHEPLTLDDVRRMLAKESSRTA